MKKRNLSVTLLAIAMLAALAGTRAPAQEGDIPVFAGAEGFGVTTAAGSAGDTLHVTHLRDSGLGSLRYALETSGPRVIVFDVGGLISLRSRLAVTEPFVSVLGQTAPSPGITLRHHDLSIRTHDVLVQHIRIRVGDEGHHKAPGTVDGIQVIGARDGSDEVYNVVVDHCSVSWTIDECVSIHGPEVHDVTFSNCIFAEGLNNSIHPKGAHGYGPMIGERTRQVAFVKNLLAHFTGRNFDLKGATETLLVNNVIYDPVWIFIGINNKFHLEPQPLATIIGNVCLKGPSARGRLSKVAYVYSVGRETRLYLADNECGDCDGRPLSALELTDPNTGVRIESIHIVDTPPVMCEHLAVLPGSQTLDYVLAGAGARPWDRDRTDRRIVQQVGERSGGIIDSQNDVGGWEAEEDRHSP